ncbi:putative Cleavage and polyadenylation specificity factor 73 [Paratrimastix pyriformis]|uniref:Cleavage and polyadenylation specificity factor 73 n=1 Tax=Paratrimastix pyriformis TaxID=342808 RepID=A0ABQ8UFM2_9EUKA|nr:putative Cleavage and polyadenylation specificity factor 73 [Paratrimastix pyriformis]
MTDPNILTVKPIGAGQEVGRSSILIEYQSRRVLLDCGVHPAKSGIGAMPFFDEIDPASIDLVLITHFHLDHSAALPYLTEKLASFKGRIFMTHPTKAIYKIMMTDYMQVSGGESGLYNEHDLQRSFDKIETVDYHQEFEVNGIRVTGYNAGHVLGAAMWLVDIGGVKVLYTGDFSRISDRHLMGAETPPVSPDGPQAPEPSESIPLRPLRRDHLGHTFSSRTRFRTCKFLLAGTGSRAGSVNCRVDVRSAGPRTAPHAREKVHRANPLISGWTVFADAVSKIVTRGGRCLIPVFALGRAQELLLILEEYWADTPSLRNIPVYFASSLASRSMKVYQTYINMMNERLQRESDLRNPFQFRYIREVKQHEFQDTGPCVVVASPGMLQNGFSRELFDRWCSNEINGVVIAGYAVEPTLAKVAAPLRPAVLVHPRLMSLPTEVETMTGERVPRLCSVDQISFSAHSDCQQTTGFVEAIRPRHVALVHGERTEMGRLRQHLLNTFPGMQVYTPGNGSTANPVRIRFPGSWAARAQGRLADCPLAPGARVQGLLVRNNFQHALLLPEDLSTFTELSVTALRNRVAVPGAMLLSLLEPTDPGDPSAAALMTGPALQALLQTAFEGVAPAPDGFMVDGLVRVSIRQPPAGASVTPEAGRAAPSRPPQPLPDIAIEWASSPAADMTADALLVLLGCAPTDRPLHLPTAAPALPAAPSASAGSGSDAPHAAARRTRARMDRDRDAVGSLDAIEGEAQPRTPQAPQPSQPEAEAPKVIAEQPQGEGAKSQEPTRQGQGEEPEGAAPMQLLPDAAAPTATPTAHSRVHTLAQSREGRILARVLREHFDEVRFVAEAAQPKVPSHEGVAGPILLELRQDALTARLRLAPAPPPAPPARPATTGGGEGEGISDLEVESGSAELRMRVQAILERVQAALLPLAPL